MRRLARTALAAGFALVVPLSSVSAASTTETAGSSLETLTESQCVAGVCTSLGFTVLRTDGQPLVVCLTINHTDAAGVSIADQEFGCSDGTVGTVTTGAGGYLTGIGPSQLTVTTSSGGSRVVTVSSANTITSAVRTVLSQGAWEEDGCQYSTTYRERLVDVTGTVTMDGTAYASAGESKFFSMKNKVRC